MCVRLNRLPELPGLLVIWLDAVMEFRVGGGPRRETEGRVWSDGGGDAKDCDCSPSSEAMSVILDEMPPTDGGRGIPSTCCWAEDRFVSPVPGRSEVAMVLDGNMQIG